MPRFTNRDLIRHQNRISGENAPLPPVPRRWDGEESRMQQCAVTWWDRACAGFGVPHFALIAHPNQGWRSPRNGARMKAEGARKGTLDMQLTVPRSGYHGLWIENKTATGRLSSDQAEHMAHLLKQGYRVAVCRSVDDFIQTITNYLSDHG